MIKEGILGKFGKPTEQTPKNWREMLYDVSGTAPVSAARPSNVLSSTTPTDESKGEKKKKDKKHKIDSDDDDNQMQTSSGVADSVVTEASVRQNFFRFLFEFRRFFFRRQVNQLKRNTKNTKRKRKKKIPIKIIRDDHFVVCYICVVIGFFLLYCQPVWQQG